jgi:hypothetical protein
MTYQTLEFTKAATPVFDVDLAGLGISGNDEVAEKGALSPNEARTFQSVYSEPSLSEQLFAAVAAAKRWTSQVAMRLPEEFRRRIFAQLDRLHDEDEWHGSSHPIELPSYQTFVRAILCDAIAGRPSLALTPRGTLTAIWQENGGRLLVEFLGNDRVRYLVTKPVDGVPERGAGDTTATRLRAVLAPFEPEKWFRAA